MRARDRETISAAVLNHIKAGLLIRQACQVVGVGERTFRTWRKQDQPLAAALKKAGAEFEAAHVQNIVNHSMGDWKASAWLLERKYPERYAKREPTVKVKQSVEVTQPVAVPISVADLHEAAAILEGLGFKAGGERA